MFLYVPHGTDNAHIWAAGVRNHPGLRPSFSHHSCNRLPSVLYLNYGFSIAINCVQNVTTIVKCREGTVRIPEFISASSTTDSWCMPLPACVEVSSIFCPGNSPHIWRRSGSQAEGSARYGRSLPDRPDSFSPDGFLLLQMVHWQRSPDALPERHPGQNFCETAATQTNCGNGIPSHLLHRQWHIPF